MANQWSVTPAGDIGQGLMGLATVIQNAQAQKDEREAEEAKRAAQAEAQTALYDAWQTQDPSKMAEVAMNYPQISEQAAQGLGLLQDYQKKEATEFATEILSNPDHAEEIAERRIQILNMQGRDPQHTLKFLDGYMRDPQGAMMGLKMNLAALNPEAYEAYLTATAPEEEADTKVVGDFLLDSKGNVLFDGSGAGNGTPEFGLTPMVYRNPETGAYTPFLPNKAGGMQALQGPEGLEFVPDAARLGYNPVNIAEKSAAETQAQRTEQLPAQQRAMVRRQQQATLVDDTIDRALEQASGWTTGFAGNLTKKIPGTPAFDLANTLDTIKSNIGFDKLQEMREQSPTGGALGQISDFENRNLQAVLGNLEQSQSREQFEYNLNQVREAVRNIVHGSEQQFLNTYGNPQQASTPNTVPSVSSQSEYDALPSGTIYLEDGVQYRKP